MSAHNSAVFNNACLKVPRNPVNKQPSPIYEQKYMNQLKNQARKLSLEMDSLNMPDKYSAKSDQTVFRSFIEFYGSIPEYGEINHLSNKDFYRKLQNLKEKQKSFYEYIQQDRKSDNKDYDWVDNNRNLNNGTENTRLSFKTTPKPFTRQLCGTPFLNKSPINRLKHVEDVESISSSDKETPTLKASSRRSVRIESPSLQSESPESLSLRSKSRVNNSSLSSKLFNKSTRRYNESVWDDLSFKDLKLDSEREISLVTKSAPSSPIKSKSSIGWKESGITIPKPFRMTVRDEENKIVEDVILNTQKPKEQKPEMFRANPVPIESKIPLFNKIVENKEKRSEIVKQKSKQALKAQMRPFSFTRREEEMQALSKRLSKSSPSIFLYDAPIKFKPFKAKPIPKRLFSNYIYQKMEDDEFYRALQRRIRAEEMLRSSSLPPSMAEREIIYPKPAVCPRSYQAVESDSEINYSSYKSPPMPDYKASHKKLAKQLKEIKNDFITTSPIPFRLNAEKRSEDRRLKRCYGSRNSSAISRNAENYRAPSAADLLSVNKSNLAAVLRINSAKKKMDMEMYKKLEEARLREEARWRKKILRKKPAWQSLAYSHEEDLAMRLQLRKEEEKLRSEEHKHRMELMYGRVNRMPMLFERSPKYKHYPDTSEDLLEKLHNDYIINKYCCRHSSPLSLSGTSEKSSDGKENQRETLQGTLQADDESTDTFNLA